MDTKTLRPDLREIVEKIRALKKLTKDSGFQTNRSCSQLLARLDADDLAAVAMELNNGK